MQIPESYNGMPVTKIASSAFRDNTKITHVVIPASVTHINGYAFAGCFSITSVSIRGNDIEFGGAVFSGCQSLMSINLPYGLKKISPEMFKECYLLPSITIPSSVTEIGIRAFGDCAWLKEISIPESVTYIATDAFRGCNRLENVRISEGLQTLGSYAFAYCPELNCVELPTSLTSIHSNVFTGSENVTVRAKMNSAAYGYAVDHGIDVESTGMHLLDLLFTYVDGGVTLEAYSGSSAYVQVPATVQGHKVLSIAPSAFESNRSIHTVVLEEGIQSIGEKAFADCTGMTSITLPSTTGMIGDYAFANSGIKNLILPAGMTVLGNYAFSNCSKLQSVRIPSALSSIGEGVFHTCKMLEKVRFDGAVPVIAAQMFAQCDALEKISIPSGTPSVGMRAFLSCEALKEVRIPDSVTNIDPTAFEFCSYPPVIFGTAGSAAQAAAEAAGFTFSTAEYSSSQGYLYTVNNERATIISYEGYQAELTIPQELDDYPVVAIAARAFEGNTRLTAIDTGAVESIGAYAFSGCTALTSVTLHDGLAQIGDHAFENTAIKQISLPDSIVSAGAYTFSGCSALQSVNMSINLTAIGAGMFNGCAALETLMISDEIASIGAGAFGGCTNLVIYGYSGSTAEQYALANGHAFLAMDTDALSDYEFAVNGDTVSLTAYRGSDTIVRIPYEYNNMPVTDIADYAFTGNAVIKRMIIPDTVTRIGYGAFADCAELESIELPSQLKYVEDCAFQYSPKLKRISLPDGTKSLGESVFTGCTGLLRIDVPVSVKEFSEVSPFTKGNYIIYTEAGAPVIEHAEKFGLDYFFIDLVDERMPRGDLFAGDNFVFHGSLQSSMPLNRARIVVTNMNTGYVEKAATWTITTGVTEYDLAGFTTLGIKNLPLGKYRCDFYAETDLPFGTEVRHLASSDFRIIESDLRIACMSGYRDPGAFHLYGELYEPVGELHATKYIDSAYVTCINTETNETFKSDTLVPQSSTRVIQMSELHESLNFAALGLGKYDYFITVSVEGTEYKIQQRKFCVVDYSSQMDPALTDALAEFCINPDNVSRFARYSGDYKDVLYGIDKWDELVIGAGASNVVIDSLVGMAKGYPGGLQAFTVKLYEKQILQNLSALVAADNLTMAEDGQNLMKIVEEVIKIPDATCSDLMDAIKSAEKTLADEVILSFLKSARNIFKCLDLTVKFAPEAVEMIAVAMGNYQEIILTLNTLSSAMGNDVSDEFNQAMNNIYLEYSNAATNVFETMVDYLLKESITSVTRVILEKWKGGSLLYVAAEWTRDLLFKVSGVQDISDNAMLFITQMNLVIEYTDSYRTWFVKANEELMDGVLNTETLERVYFMHDATKQALIDLYDIMLKGYSKEYPGSVNAWKSEKASLEAMTWL